MPFREVIQKILEAGAQAPSGSNSQPWEFRIEDNKILIFALPEKDHPILNYRWRGTWVAHGALIENIVIASSKFGFRAEIDIFPDRNQPKLAATIALEASAPKDESLYPYIFERCTNRKPYKSIPLLPEQKSKILDTKKETDDAELKLIEEPEKIKAVAESLSINELVMFENKSLHNLLFKEIVWTESEEKERGGGLYVKTMELKPPQEFALKFLKYWPIMNLANKIGAARLISRENAETYASCGAMGAIIVDDQDEDFLAAGRLMERVWLKATKMDLGFHLITGVLFLWQQIALGQSKDFSERHRDLIENAYQTIAKVFEIKKGLVGLLFRVGKDGAPTARSAKFSPKISI